MIDGTPLYLRVWGTLSDEQKTEVITKFGGTPKFDIRKEEVQNFLVKNYARKVTTKVVVK
jgi:hypothetical protein